jgi:RES domain-containing protein
VTVDYLFMSGRPSRFNTAGVKCVYFAEDEDTAAAEYERHTRPLHQPFATFFANVELTAVLDLCSAATQKALGLSAHDLKANWVRATRPTATQLLGEAVSQQARLAAIRFPSDAARMKGFAGANVVIFYDTMRSPDYVHILGLTKKPLQKWP